MPIEVTLTRRGDMLLRMQVGRTALASAGLQVDPGHSRLTGKRLPCLAENVGTSRFRG